MKKKLCRVLLGLMLIVSIFGLIACGEGDNGGKVSSDGTYYLYENGSYDKSNFVEINGDKWEDDDGETGAVKISGTSIILYVDLMGEQEELCDGTISNGVITLNMLGAKITYCKEGKTPENGNVEGGGSTVVEEKYTITYNSNGGFFENDNTTFVQNEQSSNSLLTAPTSPTRENYSFAGWAKDKNGNNMWQFANEKPTKDLTLYAIWAEKSAIIYSVDGAKIEGANILMLVDNSTSSVMLSNKVVCSKDSVWKLYYDRLGQTEIPTKIAAGTLGALNNGDNTFYIVVSSLNGVEVNVYELTIHRSYSVPVYFYNGSNIINTDYAYTGYEYSTTYTPSIAGYTFNYWEKSGVQYETQIVWGSLSLYANTTVNKYTVSLNENGGNTLSTKTKELTYDSNYSLPKPTRTGYTFEGWYNGNIQLTNSKGESLAVWNYDSDKTLMAKWTLNKYKVILNSPNTSADTVSGNGEYAYDSNVTISANTNSGYTFVGWFDSDDQLVSANLSYTFKMPTEDVTYTAKWNACAEMQNFIFYSSPSICSITEIKDKTVTEIIVPEYVTAISEGAFSGCSSLKSITLPFVGGSKTATSANNSTLFGYIFGKSSYSGGKSSYQYYSPSYGATYCMPSTLKNVTITGGNILYGAFYGCSNLTSIEISDNITSIGNHAFYGCSNLTSIEIPNSITSIEEYAFYDCSNLTSIEIPNSVTSLGESAFGQCYKLIEVINKSNLNITAGSKDNGRVGYYAKQVLIEKPTTSNFIEKEDYVFYNANGTYYLYFFRNKGITDMELVLPNDMNGNNYSICQYAFYYCTNLTSITIPNSVTSIGEAAFKNCGSLTNITIPNSVTSIGDDAFSGCGRLRSITIPNSITSIGNGVFYSCSDLESITIPDSVTSIGENTFSSCRRLKWITIPHSVTSIGQGVFEDCNSLEKIWFGDISNWYRTPSYTNWGNKIGGTQTDVTFESANATNFKDTYVDYYWYKKLAK